MTLSVIGLISWGLLRWLTPTLLAFISAVGGFVVAIWTFTKTKEKDVDARLFPQKADVYASIFALMNQVMNSDKPWNTALSPDEMAQKLTDIQYKMLIWSSAKAINAFNTFSSSTSDPGDTIARLAYLYGSLRRDLGHNDRAADCIDIASHTITADERDAVRSSALTSEFYQTVVLKEFRLS